ncbi:sensor histidine kinase [Anaerotardibacter muris]|uniref:sensor histidine kinase n=1 Tax=Anaerotardibacter muris TaxID=2941505 RepID=UPI00203C8397|nr:ATP-binding protein [Anaerotardibacter muris]
MSEEELEYEEPSDEKKHKGFSFTARITVSFAAIALMTVMVAVGMLSFVWEQYFQSYTRDNMENLAESIADSVEQNFKTMPNDWYNGALAAATSANALYDTVNIQIVSSDGWVVYNSGAQGSIGNLSFSDNERNTASAPIVVNDEQVGTVYVRVFGSDTLLTQADQDFRNKSYQAMIFASVFSVLVAVLAGFILARLLSYPINLVTNAARALKEGDYSARTGMVGEDEIARLGKTFDQMADAVEANRDMERRLVTDVAHELRTPLMAIQSTVEAMIDGVFEADEERLETLNSEVRRLSRLVDALLKLSRLENRANKVEFAKIDLVEQVERVVLAHQAYVEESGLDFTYEHDDHVIVYGNADLLRQATANLISNAVRYTPEGGSITVRVTQGELMGKIMVQDTGIGFTPEEAKNVFARFWRADAGRARESGGLGIGLSVVKEIADRHNGWVRAEGRPNEGARFTIYIPLYSRSTSLRKGKTAQAKRLGINN